MQSSDKEIFSVSRLNQDAKKVLADAFEPIWVEGEVSNIASPSSGHLYFSLKDKQSQIRCAMFHSRNQTLTFKLEHGMKLLVHARVDLYTARGDFQLIVDRAEPFGAGEIQQRFEALKQKLNQEGLFDPANKRPIPTFPESVGIITSEKSAALRDILNIFKKRQALFNVIIYPSLVQGRDAPASIRTAIEVANQHRETDVLIIARGGGSLEDLDSFNDEKLVRVLAASEIPTVSGIGHEIDFTLADFAADIRTPTPTAAAVKICRDSSELVEQLASSQKRLASVMRYKVDSTGLHLRALKSDLMRLHPQMKLEELTQRFDETWERLLMTMRHIQSTRKTKLVNLARLLEHCSPLDLVKSSESRLQESRSRLNTAISQHIIRNNYALKECQVKLHARNPFAILKSGYSVTTDEQGAVIRSASQVKPGRSIKIYIEKGEIGALVKKVIARKQRKSKMKD